MKGTHCKCNSFPEQVFKSVSKSLVRCISKNSCLLLILHVLNWERFPPAQVLRSLRCLGAECWELQLASSIYPFLISPNLLGGLPSISRGAGSSFLRPPESCPELCVQCECIHTEPCHSYSVPYTKPQGSCFWVSVMCSCSKVLARSTEGTDSILPKYFQIPLLLHGG